MPIYEYRCHVCGKRFELFFLNVQTTSAIHCKYCQSQKVERLISRVRVIKSEESRLESLADPSKLSGLDQKDPRSIARWVKKMSKEVGEDIGEDVVDQMVEEAMEKQSKAQENSTE